MLLQMALFYSFLWLNSIPLYICTRSSLLFVHQVMSDFSWPCGQQNTRLPCPSPFPRACSSSCPLNWWCYPTISSSVTLFSCLQSVLASGLFQWVGCSHHSTLSPCLLTLELDIWYLSENNSLSFSYCDSPDLGYTNWGQTRSCPRFHKLKTLELILSCILFILDVDKILSSWLDRKDLFKT